jgi:hypothetical protein
MSTSITSGLIGLILGAALSCPLPAEAHFILQSPAALSTQPGGYNTPPYGGAQKSSPCGQADTGYATTGATTTFNAGQMITISILETIYHPGNYRVAIAPNMNMLPSAPTVTPMGGDDCAVRAPVDTNPQLPILADGLFQHSTNFNGTAQSAQIKLPDGYTCQNCVLQVIEYMKNHGAPCYYYHCATVNIVDNNAPDGGITMPPDMAMIETPPPPPPAMETGCAYAPLQHATLLHFSPLALLGLVALRRRRRA